jgi:hypothetical protein
MMMMEYCIDTNDSDCLDKCDEFDEDKSEYFSMVFDDMNVVHNNQQLLIVQDMMNSMMIHY